MTEILILDFNREDELKTLLDSIKYFANFEKRVVVLNNGGERYADKYKDKGLIDEVIHNRVNIGCGAATVQLFAQCRSDYAFYIQVDHELQYELTEEHIKLFKDSLTKNNQIFYVDLNGDQGHGKYSERAQFINRNKYLSAPISFGGPGPLEDLLWSEESIQNYMAENNLTFASFNIRGIPPFKDCGKRSVRTNPDGSIWSHEPDTKRLWLKQGPIKEKFSYPKFTDSEWEEVIKNQSWPDGNIPEKEKDHSFVVPHWH